MTLLTDDLPHVPFSTFSRLARSGSAIVLCLAASATLAQQPPMPEGPPSAWVRAAVDNEIKIVAAEDSQPLRYRERKIDARGDITREVVETRDGAVARLIERNGQPIAPAEDAAERTRLTDLLTSPDEFYRHHRHDASQRDYVVQLIKQLPQAMIYSYAPEQPQTKGSEASQIVLDYHSDPAYHPSSMLFEVLTGLEGRVWIDARTQRVTRIEGHVTRPLNFGFGIVAKIFPGGTVVFEQGSASGDRWLFRHISEHITLREMMVKTVPQNAELTTSDYRPLPAALPYREAIKLLLADQIASR